jgi:RHH-type proline utilization regulon transcriptional repressor/proline dehydrogenase/delta 1-pyrroline-5-carboxylate dehydrogenase
MHGLADPRLVRPALVELDRIDRLTGEVFGPVLHVVRYKRGRLDAVLRAIEATGYALTFGIHTRLDETVTRAEGGQSAGNVYVNRNMVGAIVGTQPFGGSGLSGTGPKAGGPLTIRRLLATAGPLDPALAGTPPERTHAFAALLTATGHDRDGILRRTLAFTPCHACLDLPGPVGERNVYALEPRGPILCRATTEAGALAQLAAVLATGNDPVIEPGFPCPDAYRAFAADARTANLQAALHEGDSHSLAALAQELAARDGPIVTIHTAPYAPEFLLRERVVTTNTAAAGGNASLMAIG